VSPELCEAKIDAFWAKDAHSEAMKRTPLSRGLQIGSILSIVAGAGLTFSMMMASGDPEPRSLGMAGGAYLIGLILAVGFAWRTR
jgi:hypothetical protein